MSDPTDSRRLSLVTAAQKRWIDALTDLGGRNTLLYFKDRRAGTLDLALADPQALEKFLNTGHIRLTRLFTDVDERADAIRRMQTIHRKARELQEERGIRAGYLATGMACWDELFLEPAAPVLLRGLTITPTRARYDDFDLTLDSDDEVNPVLVHKLASVFGAVIDAITPDNAALLLAEAARAAEIPGFRIEPRQVIGTFTYAKLPMVRDMESATELLLDSDLVAAIAGDPEAQELVSADPDQGGRSGRGTVPVDDTPEDDYTVLDADSSQRSAIEVVLSGCSLVIHGPPGTGKSQTIANLIATLIARGRKVLFVAEKRAAIDAVYSRLAAAGLSDVVLDIHEGTRDRQRIAHDLGDTLDLSDPEPPDTGSLRRRLVDRQARLKRHVDALHRVHEPWGVTAYQVQSELLGLGVQVTARLATPEGITPEIADRLRDELSEFAHLGGFTLRPESTPWFGAAIRGRAQARDAIEVAVTLHTRTLPRLNDQVAAVRTELDLQSTERRELIALLTDIARAGSLPFRERRALRKDINQRWEAPGEPRLPSGFAALMATWEEYSAQLATLRSMVVVGDDVDKAVAALAADQETPWKLPRLYELAQRFDAVGLRDLLDELARAGADPDEAVASFSYVWLSSILDVIKVRDPRYGAADGEHLDEIADDFRHRDVEHLVANRARVRRVWAAQLRETVDKHPLQARVIRKQAALRRGHLPLRRLLDQTGDVLFALKPCWAMSPLMVSQVLPAARLFDVVIFDEASQIVPADAIGSIIRAHQVVVAGDDRQLPPSNFFRQFAEAAEEDEDDLVAFDGGFESVLDALRPLLPTCSLSWHYRSRDERLVAFANERIYGGALTTFPGVARDDCLRHVVVAQDSGVSGQDSSVEAEVREVVAQVLAHARLRPNESLGVIALGVKHAERIDVAVRQALASAPELESFFAEDRPEPFFVKNLERVQGDERDAIVLSVGYGKHPDGRMRYQWGPLLRDGGERRLNVAATRAKLRLTVVSSFSSGDIDRSKLTKAGAKLLAEYLEYASVGGVPVAASGSGRDIGAFEASVRSRLASLGIAVVPQYGVGGYRVDFALSDPADPSRMILAVESDGASYRDSGSVRDRDRLRKEHLERLGWRFHRLWSTSWFSDPEGELSKLRTAYDRALRESPPGPSAPPADPPPESSARPEPASSPAPADPPPGPPLARPMPAGSASYALAPAEPPEQGTEVARRETPGPAALISRQPDPPTD
jgi:very-short-patch-repair endonuclease